MKKIVSWLSVWTGLVSVAHAWLNVNWAEVLNERLPLERRKLNVAYIPVT